MEYLVDDVMKNDCLFEWRVLTANNVFKSIIPCGHLTSICTCGGLGNGLLQYFPAVNDPLSHSLSSGLELDNITERLRR